MSKEDAKKIRVGMSVARKDTLQTTTVIEIIRGGGEIIAFRCTDGIFTPDSLLPSHESNDKTLLQLFLESPKTQVFINHNQETGAWLYSVEVEGSDGFWLSSFETEEEARAYIAAHHLREVGAD